MKLRCKKTKWEPPKKKNEVFCSARGLRSVRPPPKKETKGAVTAYVSQVFLEELFLRRDFVNVVMMCRNFKEYVSENLSY